MWLSRILKGIALAMMILLAANMLTSCISPSATQPAPAGSPQYITWVTGNYAIGGWDGVSLITLSNGDRCYYGLNRLSCIGVKE